MSGRPSRVQALLLGAYPPSFRARYGAELESLVADSGTSPRVALDLFRGVMRAWLRPTGPRDVPEHRRWRLEATSATVFVAWCAALVAMAGFSRGVDDSPLPGLETFPASAFFRIAETAFSVSVVLVVLELLFYSAVVLVPAVRAHQRRVWLPVAVSLVAGALWSLSSLGMAALVQPYAGNGPSSDARLLISLGVALLAWLVVGGLCLGASALGAPLAMRRAYLRERLLAPGALGGILISLALAISAVTALGCLVELSGHNPPGDLVPAAAGVILLVGAAVAATTSAARGISALRHAGSP